MKKYLVLILMYSMLLLGCPSKNTIQDAKRESARLAGYANTAVNIGRELWREGVISDQVATRTAKSLSTLASGGIAFDTAILRLEANYGNKVPKSEIELLFAVFETEVVEKLVEVLKDLGAVSNAAALVAKIVEIRNAVMTIARAFGKEKQVEAKLAV